MKLEKIVVAVDFSTPSLEAVRWTAEHLAPEADIALAHCIELPGPGSILWETLPPKEDLVTELHQRAVKRLDQLVKKLPSERVQAHIRTGHPAEEIATVVSEQDADLVVAGKHSSHHGIWHVLGSTAEQLVVTCHRPVLLARNLPSGPLKNLLVPVDNSEVAVQALGWAATLGRRHGAALVAHHVVSDWYYQQVRQVSSELAARAAQNGVTDRALEWLANFVAEHVHNVPVSEHVSSGQPGFQTLAAIESTHADLVVVGSHGLRSLIGDPLSRLSRFLIMAAPCSLFVVPENEHGPGA